tara:strand:+ start:1624 stop:3009 length:1386 start_codon:yes stop_codon:yes gene_type:complete
MKKGKIVNRETWASKMGFILAGAGSAIGLGNIWRFPTTAGQNGGAAFIFIYLFSVIFICLSVLIAELALGRNTKKNPVGAYNSISPHSAWKYFGILGVLTGWGIASFYSVVAGWTLAYIFKTATGFFSSMTSEQISSSFTEFVSNPLSSISLHLIFMSLTMAILFGGVKKGIEKWSKILMPVLLVILFLLVLRSVLLPDSKEGFQFLFKPDWSAITGRSVLAAVGQAFFSLSLGMGTMIVYGSYLSKNENLISSAAWVASLDTIIALMAGLAIFPALFAFGLEPTIGAGLIFVVLPNIFNEMFLGTLFGSGFFILLGIAALTSMISIVEVPVAYFIDEFKWSRKKSVKVAGIGAFCAGIPAALSLGALDGLSNFISIEGRNYGFLDFMNLIFGQYSLMIGSVGVALFTGWKWGKDKIIQEITNGYENFSYGSLYNVFIKFIAPFSLLFLLIYLILNPNAFA